MKCYADLHTHPASPLPRLSSTSTGITGRNAGPLCTLTTQEPEKESISPPPPVPLLRARKTSESPPFSLSFLFLTGKASYNKAVGGVGGGRT